MSMPNVPDIKPEISLKRGEAINLLLTSIALEEIGLSHIINAEAEKIQFLLKDHCSGLEELLQINSSVADMLRNIASNQILLQFKLADVMKLDRQHRHHHHHHHGHDHDHHHDHYHDHHHEEGCEHDLDECREEEE